MDTDTLTVWQTFFGQNIEEQGLISVLLSEWQNQALKIVVFGSGCVKNKHESTTLLLFVRAKLVNDEANLLMKINQNKNIAKMDAKERTVLQFLEKVQRQNDSLSRFAQEKIIL